MREQPRTEATGGAGRTFLRAPENSTQSEGRRNGGGVAGGTWFSVRVSNVAELAILTSSIALPPWDESSHGSRGRGIWGKMEGEGQFSPASVCEEM